MPRKIITPTYLSWRAMRQRCLNPNAHGHENYSDRGIKICNRWDAFEVFLQDMGERPVGKTLDRFPDPNGNYEPENCRWATWKEQRRNTRTNRLITIENKTQPLSAWCEEAGLRHDTVSLRLKNGWSPEKALTTPIQKPYAKRRLGL